MPFRWSIWDKSKPAGPPPMIATCVRVAIFSPLSQKGPSPVGKSQLLKCASQFHRDPASSNQPPGALYVAPGQLPQQRRRTDNNPNSAVRYGRREGQLWVKGGCRCQVDGTAGLPSVPELSCAPKQLRLVPKPQIRPMARCRLRPRRRARTGHDRCQQAEVAMGW